MTVAEGLGLAVGIVAIIAAGIPSFRSLHLQQQERDEKARAGLEFAARSDVEELEEKVRALERRLGGPPASTTSEAAHSEPELEPQVGDVVDLARPTYPDVITVPASSRVLGRFARVESDEPARVVVRQLDQLEYRLVEPFRYLDGDTNIFVPAGWLTDLGPLPRVLEWFVPRYGPEMLPRLLHDYLVTEGVRDGTVSSVEEADRIFLRALEAVGVPPVRRYIIASAATMAGRWRQSVVSRLAVAVWLLVMTTSSTLGVYGVATLNPRAVLVALLVPIPASLLWGIRRTLLGLGAAVMWYLTLLPGTATVIAYSLYSNLERVVHFVGHPRGV